MKVRDGSCPVPILRVLVSARIRRWRSVSRHEAEGSPGPGASPNGSKEATERPQSGARLHDHATPHGDFVSRGTMRFHFEGEGGQGGHGRHGGARKGSRIKDKRGPSGPRDAGPIGSIRPLLPIRPIRSLPSRRSSPLPTAGPAAKSGIMATIRAEP